MRGPLTISDVEKLYRRASTPEDHRAAAQQFTEWAEDPHPEDRDVSTASLLVNAGEQLAEAGDTDESVAFLRRAVDAGQHVAPDVRCYLHGGLLRSGDEDAARSLADELRRERSTDGDFYAFMSENYERADDLREAHRWLTMGIQRLANNTREGDEAAAEGVAGLIAARFRVRQALDLPLDEYDTVVASALLDGRAGSESGRPG